MAKPKSKSDTFGTFLRTMQEIESREDLTKQNVSPTPQSASGSLERSQRILLYLAERDGPQPVTDLLPISGLTFSDFYSAITTLREVGLIDLSGEPGHEQAQLTTAGRYVAQLE